MAHPRLYAYPRHLEVAKDTTPLAAEYAPVSDLRRVRVAVHLRQLQLGLRAHARREGRVADDVAEGLSVCGKRARKQSVNALPVFSSVLLSSRLSSLPASRNGAADCFWSGPIGWADVPLRLVLLVHLPLGVVADDLDVDEAAQVELLRPEHRHLGEGFCGRGKRRRV